MYGKKYNSYGQNTDINGGGTIISTHSAVESNSKKFMDGDDTDHMYLNRSKNPSFLSPSSIIGKGSTHDEIETIYTAIYMLAPGSPCIDTGSDYEALDILFDLQHQNTRKSRRHGCL